jgi:hypothetical protein
VWEEEGIFDTNNPFRNEIRIRIQYDFIGFIPLDEAIGRKVMLYPKKTSLLFYESLSCTRPLLSAAETKRYWGSTFRFKLV